MACFSSEEMKRFNYLSFEIDSAYHDAAVKMGLSDSAMLVLYAICAGGEACPLSDIPRLSGVSKQTINSALRKLEAEGLVYLKAGGGRKKLVCLTGRGGQVAERTVARVIGIENDIFSSWSEGERSLYLELTMRYLTEFKKRIEAEL